MITKSKPKRAYRVWLICSSVLLLLLFITLLWAWSASARAEATRGGLLAEESALAAQIADLQAETSALRDQHEAELHRLAELPDLIEQVQEDNRYQKERYDAIQQQVQKLEPYLADLQ